MSELYRIKPLEWVEYGAGQSWVAKTPLGYYVVQPPRVRYKVLDLPTLPAECDYAFPGCRAVLCGTVDEGKAACQRHHRERVVALLEPAEPWTYVATGGVPAPGDRHLTQSSRPYVVSYLIEVDDGDEPHVTTGWWTGTMWRDESDDPIDGVYAYMPLPQPAPPLEDR